MSLRRRQGDHLGTEFEIFVHANKKEKTSEDEASSGSEEEDEIEEPVFGGVNLDDNDDSDSDGAPEDISFNKGKEEALAEIKKAVGQIRNNKKLEKQRKREQHEKNKEQKEHKLEELAKRKLPADFLDTLKTGSAKPKKKKEEMSDDFSHIRDEDIDDLIAGFGGDEEDDDDDEGVEETDFISLNKKGRLGNVVPVVLKSIKPTSTENFKHNMLYNRPDIKRVPTSELVMQKEKRQAIRKYSKPTKVKLPCKKTDNKKQNSKTESEKSKKAVKAEKKQKQLERKFGVKEKLKPVK